MKKTPTSGPSEFYLHKRRLAMLFAGLSVTLLVFGLVVGLFLESYSKPRAAFDGETLRFTWTAHNHDEESAVTRVAATDPDLRLQGPPARLGGAASAVLGEGDETLLFFGPRYSVVKDGNTVRGAALDQPWAVLAAARDPGRRAGWLFGHDAGRLVARRRELGAFSDTQAVAPSGAPERVVASLDGPAGPLVAWRERGSAVVKTAVYDGAAFVPRAEFRIGAIQHWDAVLVGPRILIVTYDRADRSYSTVGVRVRCCEGCPAPLASTLVRLEDPTLFLGKIVTGLAAAAAGERLALFVTRWSSAQAATVPLDAPGDGRLVILHQEPRWRHVAGFLLPSTMLFFSFSLVFLGFALLRERTQFVLEKLTPPSTEGPLPAAILQRAMAFILDLLVLVPIFGFLVVTLDLAPDRVPGPEDLSFWVLGGFASLLQAVYGLAMEASLGWTLGKRIIGLRVVELDGRRVGFRGALLRNLVRPLDSGFLLGAFVGMSVIMATRRRQRLGDLLAKTMVVEDRP